MHIFTAQWSSDLGQMSTLGQGKLYSRCGYVFLLTMENV